MKTIKRMDIVSKARRERESAEFHKRLREEAEKAIDSWRLTVIARREEENEKVVQYCVCRYGDGIFEHITKEDMLNPHFMSAFDNSYTGTMLRLNKASKVFVESFKKTPFYKAMVGAVNEAYKLDKSIQEAVEEAKKDGVIK